MAESDDIFSVASVVSWLFDGASDAISGTFSSDFDCSFAFSGWTSVIVEMGSAEISRTCSSSSILSDSS